MDPSGHPLPYARGRVLRPPNRLRIFGAYLFGAVVALLDVAFSWNLVFLLYVWSKPPNPAWVYDVGIAIWITILGGAIVVCGALGLLVTPRLASLDTGSGGTRLLRLIRRVLLASTIGAPLVWVMLGFVTGWR